MTTIYLLTKSKKAITIVPLIVPDPGQWIDLAPETLTTPETGQGQDGGLG